MTNDDVMRDERTVAIENESYRWAYRLLSFGLLLSTAYRAFLRNEASWDLLGLVILGGIVASAHQGANHVLTRRWVRLNLLTVIIATIVAIVLVFAIRWRRGV